jgi:ATP-binding cassette subfamily F protein 3
VGWSDEAGTRTKSGRKKAADKNGNRKDAKKLRASLVSDKSKVLGMLKNRIAALETEITELEQRVDGDTRDLLEASVTGKALEIKRLTQSVNEAKARIEDLFTELETVTLEHDAKVREFDEQLAGLAGIS